MHDLDDVSDYVVHENMKRTDIRRLLEYVKYLDRGEMQRRPVPAVCAYNPHICHPLALVHAIAVFLWTCFHSRIHVKSTLISQFFSPSF